jgi:hypothetical protein
MRYVKHNGSDAEELLQPPELSYASKPPNSRESKRKKGHALFQKHSHRVYFIDFISIAKTPWRLLYILGSATGREGCNFHPEHQPMPWTANKGPI